MKTEVRKEHGDWIVFVDDNPVFSFMYREEAEKVRNMIDALVEAHDLVVGIQGSRKGSIGSIDNVYLPQLRVDRIEKKASYFKEVLKYIGAI